MHNYNVLTTFDGPRISGPRRSAISRTGVELRQFGVDHCNVSAPLPVGGAPMPARHTLLAHVVRNNRLYYGLLTGRLGPESACTANAIRSLKDECPPAEPAAPKSKASVDMVKRNKSLIGKMLGVEIECYPSPTSRGIPGFTGDEERTTFLTTVGGDGSLNSGGVEVRRITWANKNGRLGGLLALRNRMKGTRVDKACGLHVHVDARHLTKDEEHPTQHTAAATYDRLTKFYPHLKKLVPRSRWENRYCQWVNNRPGSEDYGRPGSGDRYCAINFCSFSEHGSLEFRMAAGSTNMLKIESWALLCAYLVKWASVKENSIPKTWKQFIAILPEWMGSWCVIRNAQLHGDLGKCDDRVLSALGYDSDGVFNTVE